MSTLSSIRKNCTSIDLCRKTIRTNYRIMLSITGGSIRDEKIHDDVNNLSEIIYRSDESESIRRMCELNIRIMREIADESARRLQIQVNGGEVGYPY